MKKTVIMLIDTDEKYLVPIELKIIEQLGDDIELNVITDINYLKNYFSVPRQIDILVINESIYSTDFEKHNIKNTFILTEKEEDDITFDLNLHKLYKYTSVKEIYEEIINRANIVSREKEKNTKVVMVYSPIGGCGKTTVALGIAAKLNQLNKNVLYISSESIQSFDFLLSNNEYSSNGFEKVLSNKDEKILNYLEKAIGKKPFHYLLPFKQSLSSLNIGIDEIKYLIDRLKESNLYEYIILDTSCEFDANKSMLMGYCEKVIILSQQTKVDAIKLKAFISNIDCSNQEKFIFICNKYIEKENYLIKDEFVSRYHINYYIDLYDEEEIDIKSLSNDKCFTQLVYMFI